MISIHILLELKTQKGCNSKPSTKQCDWCNKMPIHPINLGFWHDAIIVSGSNNYCIILKYVRHAPQKTNMFVFWGACRIASFICTDMNTIADWWFEPERTPAIARWLSNYTHEQSVNHISLRKGLDVMQSHPLCKTCFSQYQTSSAALG